MRPFVVVDVVVGVVVVIVDIVIDDEYVVVDVVSVVAPVDTTTVVVSGASDVDVSVIGIVFVMVVFV